MKFGYTIFYVQSVEETIQFYEAAFGFNRIFLTPEKDYGELSTGGTTLAFASIELGKSNFKNGFHPIDETPKPVGMELAFVTEDIENDFQKAIDAGARSYENVTAKPWGQKVGYVLDNNGIIIELCTPIKTA